MPDDNAATAGAASDDELIPVELTKPIPVYEDKISVIKFRPPTAADIMAIGNPVHFIPGVEPVQVDHHPERMPKMLARLAVVDTAKGPQQGIPISSLSFMDSRDFMSCAWAISHFFIPRVPAI